MTLNETMKYIATMKFQIQFSVLSGFSSVLSAFTIDETVQSLIYLLRENPDNQAVVLERLKTLVPDYQKDYMHTHDIPVCVYLYALDQVNSLGALETITPAIVSKKEFFWARQMAMKIMEKLTITILSQQRDVTYNKSIDFVPQDRIDITSDSPIPA